MPSSITLTVSHLPTSTSFFLSALQPLQYAYRGRSDNTIGFGSTTNPSAPPDFWITQEIPGVPAGAAHIAFQADSRNAVQSFFISALKAGGTIHGEPAVRDSSGYYSATIIDFDGNSIEAVFRPDLSDGKEYDTKSTVSSKTMTKALSLRQSQVSRAPPADVVSSVSRSAPRSEAPSPARRFSGDVVEGIVSEARSATNVARTLLQSVSASQPSQSRPTGHGDSNVICGTLLGVAAGAALHYAFTHDKNSKSRPPALSRSFTEPTISGHYQSYGQHNGPQYLTLEDNDYASTIRPARSTASSHHDGNGGRAVYSTSFGNGSTTSKASHGPKRLEAPPSSFVRAPPASSQVSQSPSQHTKPTTTTPSITSSRPSTVRHVSDRCNTSIKHAPSASTTSTTTPAQSTRHNAIPPTPSTATTASRAHTASSKPLALSEANLARAITAPTPTVASLHIRNEEPEAYPIHTGRSRSGRSSRSRVGSKAGSKMEVDVMPEDSVSQISSVRSASTVRVGGRR